MRRSPAEIALSLGVLGLGGGAAAITAALPAEGGYSGVGPSFFPAVVSAGLVALGLWLLYEALSGGWRHGVADDAEARGEHALHAGAFVWVSAGLFAQILLIDSAGFIPAQAVLFAAVARGFGSRRLARDLAIGMLIAAAVYLFFVRFLNINLPAGWLAPLLGSPET
jgi:putative tricarboxylic transport membrane protein